MRLNESATDRIIRVLAGVGIAAVFLVAGHPAWALLGAIPVLTGVVGFCPLYRALGISSRKISADRGG